MVCPNIFETEEVTMAQVRKKKGGKIHGVPKGGYGPARAGAGVRLGRGASIRSSSDSQDEALLDTTPQVSCDIGKVKFIPHTSKM